jgi:hypothetical protein
MAEFDEIQNHLSWWGKRFVLRGAKWHLIVFYCLQWPLNVGFALSDKRKGTLVVADGSRVSTVGAVFGKVQAKCAVTNKSLRNPYDAAPSLRSNDLFGSWPWAEFPITEI